MPREEEKTYREDDDMSLVSRRRRPPLRLSIPCFPDGQIRWMKADGGFAEVIRWVADGVSTKTYRAQLKEKNRGLRVKGPPTAAALSSPSFLRARENPPGKSPRRIAPGGPSYAPEKNPPGASRRGDCSPSPLFRT